jgi:cyclophilin family peptidyl-prolyl cis-trans isomerase
MQFTSSSVSSSRRVRLFEALEPRWLMANPVIADIDDVTLPGGKSIILPLNASDADGGPITYTVTSDDADFKVKLHAGNPYLRLTVANYGVMTFELLRDVAPRTVDHIAGLVQAGFYDGLAFHRVIDDFMIQGGDPNGDGSGGPQYEIDDEFHPDAIFTGLGQLAMAKSNDDTNGSQFFITESSPRHLDFNHTIFGQLVRGLGVLRDIAAAPVQGSVPKNAIVITKAELINNKTDAVVTITSKNAGSATITVVAKDEDGNTDARTFEATATSNDVYQGQAFNNAPFLGPVPDVYTDKNKPITIVLSGTDIDGGQQFFDAADWDALGNVTVKVEGDRLTITPRQDFVGRARVGVGVRSATSQFDIQVFHVTVGDLPIVANPAGITASAGQSATVRVASFVDTDAAGTAAQYAAEIHWGDGTKSDGTVVAGGSGEFLVEGTHTFAQAGNYPVRVIITGGGGARGDVLSTAVVSDGAPLVNAGPDVTIAEGGALSRVGSFVGPGTWTATVDYGDGSEEEPLDIPGGNFSLDHDYEDDGAYTVTVTLTSGSLVITDTFTVAVTRVAPTASVGGDKNGVRGQVRTITLAATDPSAEDQAEGFKYEINWGDNSPVQKTGKGAAAASHAFSAAGTYKVRVRAIDRDGVAGAWTTRKITIAEAQLQADPWDSGKQALVVGGTNGKDKITIAPSGKNLKVTIGKAVIGGFNATGRIIVYGQGGNDIIVIDRAVTRDAELRGDAGNDVLRGGSGNDVLIGGSGDDALTGNGGRDLLIGGLGADTLAGGADDDLLIASATKYDGSSASLQKIMQEWTGSADYATRVDRLVSGGGGTLGAIRLSGTKVRGDTSVDILTGQAGTDAFWLSVKGTKDRAKDRTADESRTKTA